MRRLVVYLFALVTLAIHCKSSIPKEEISSSKPTHPEKPPKVKKSEVIEESLEFIDESPAYVIKINGNHLFQQIDITPEEILERVQMNFALETKPFVQKIIVNNLTNILESDLNLYLFQDKINEKSKGPSALTPIILAESSALCKTLRLARFDGNTKVRRKGALRSLENKSIPYHIVWSKDHVLIADTSMYALDHLFRKFEKDSSKTFFNHAFKDSIKSNSIASYMNIELHRKSESLVLEGIDIDRFNQTKFYLKDLQEKFTEAHHALFVGQVIKKDHVTTSQFHAHLYNHAMTPCKSTAALPQNKDLQLVSRYDAIGYGNIFIEEDVISDMLNEIDIVELLERFIGNSNINTIKKYDPFGLVERVEDAINDHVDLGALKRFYPSGNVSFGVYEIGYNDIGVAALIHGNTQSLSKIQPWLEKIPQHWLPKNRGIYLSPRGIILGYGMSSSELRQIATSNAISIDPTILNYTTGVFAKSKLLMSYLDNLSETDLYEDLMNINDVIKFMDGTYEVSFGLDPVSELQIKIVYTQKP